MSNRPLKNKKKVVLEEEDHEVEYRPPGRTSRDVIVQLGRDASGKRGIAAIARSADIV